MWERGRTELELGCGTFAWVRACGGGCLHWSGEVFKSRKLMNCQITSGRVLCVVSWPEQWVIERTQPLLSVPAQIQDTHQTTHTHTHVSLCAFAGPCYKACTCNAHTNTATQRRTPTLLWFRRRGCLTADVQQGSRGDLCPSSSHGRAACGVSDGSSLLPGDFHCSLISRTQVTQAALHLTLTA